MKDESRLKRNTVFKVNRVSLHCHGINNEGVGMGGAGEEEQEPFKEQVWECICVIVCSRDLTQVASRKCYRLEFKSATWLDQIPASHLLAASVMSAPAALAMAKLMCPETSPKSDISSADVYKVDITG